MKFYFKQFYVFSHRITHISFFKTEIYTNLAYLNIPFISLLNTRKIIIFKTEINEWNEISNVFFKKHLNLGFFIVLIKKTATKEKKSREKKMDEVYKNIKRPEEKETGNEK